MIIQILMPALSPTMEEGKLSKWLVKEGDNIKAGDLLAEIETDKAIMEFESSEDGIIKKILINESSDNVKVNEPIALLESSTEIQDEKDLSIKNISIEKRLKKEPVNTNAIIAKDLITQNNQKTDLNNGSIEIERIKVSPLAKRIALQNNINFKEIKGSGPGGRIVKIDVENYLKKAPIHNPLNSKKMPSEFTSDDYILLSPMRKTIAERLSKAKREVPHFYLRKKVFVDKLISTRKLLNKKLIPKNIKISLNDFIIKSVGHALYNNPNCNVSWGEDKIIKSKKIDVALAVAIDDGLLTPVVRNIKDKSLSDLSIETKSLIEKSRDKRLKPDEFVGGTITISNLGMMGIDSFDAIINPPHGSILAIGQTQEILTFDNHENVVKKTILELTLSADHRMIDGAVGAKFLKNIAHFLEEPIYLLA